MDYTSSAYELLWQANAGAWSKDCCAALRQSAQAVALTTWLATTIPLSAPATIASQPALLAGDPTLAVFSRLRFNASGRVVEVGIEPLAGVLRDPRSVCGEGLVLLAPSLGLRVPHNGEIQSHEFIGLDTAYLQRMSQGLQSAHPPRRVFLFDLGCTRWSDRVMPGLRWLYDTYAAVGLHFTDIYAWEANPERSRDFFDGMTLEVLSTFHFYNRAANNVRGSADNPLELLRLVARPEDFVVFKLDIDTPAVEKPIILDILGDPRYSCLIDELYFEHHAAIPEMWPYWEDRVEGTLRESQALFQALRRVGILAHSWP